MKDFKQISSNIILVGLVSLVGSAFAAPQPSQTNTTAKATTRYCPEIKDIYKSKESHWGTATGNFRSFDTSFAKKLNKFIGAQWQGANLGYVTCVYQPNDPNLFYVTLLYNKLTYEPTTQNTHWARPKSGSWLDCHSENQQDCPFVIRPDPKKQNVYQEAEQLKQEANPYDDPGF